MTDAAGIETASGKHAAGENFPVGSRLLPAALRPHVAAFYDFARTADDIADDPVLPPEEKLARLARLEGALRGDDGDPMPAAAKRMRVSLQETGVTARHCLELLDAFRQDAQKARYRDWDDLLDYCNRSAAPVGRYLLDLHGEEQGLYGASDALCNALQILNHLQDCAEDYLRLDRVYLPQRWLDEAGIGVETLARKRAGAPLRRVFDRMLDGVDDLLFQGEALAGGIRGRRLAMEASAILAIAVRLSARLRREDPLARPVRLGRATYSLCMLRGIGRGLLGRRGDAAAARRRQLGAQVARSGTSFYWAMRLLPRNQRDAMFAIYAFSRSVDDIADGDIPPDEKRRRLADWRAELERVFERRPQTAIGASLAEAAVHFPLQREDLEAIVDGVEMDVTGAAQAPDMATLELYCSRVAGAVGQLSLAVFGERSPDGRRGALALGHAMQLTNILRDISEDAARGRLYLPHELLTRQGIAVAAPADVVRDPRIAEACADLAAIAETRFDEAELAFRACNGRRLWPARAMMAIYRLLLRRLAERGWARLAERPTIGPATKLWITLRAKLA